MSDKPVLRVDTGRINKHEPEMQLYPPRKHRLEPEGSWSESLKVDLSTMEMRAIAERSDQYWQLDRIKQRSKDTAHLGVVHVVAYDATAPSDSPNSWANARRQVAETLAANEQATPRILSCNFEGKPFALPTRQTKAPKHRSLTGYGSKIPTRYLVLPPWSKQWQRVYCYCYSNIGTCYIFHPTMRNENGSRAWVIISD
jgi:hypothetical protein